MESAIQRTCLATAGWKDADVGFLINLKRQLCPWSLPKRLHVSAIGRGREKGDTIIAIVFVLILDLIHTLILLKILIQILIPWQGEKRVRRPVQPT